MRDIGQSFCLALCTCAMTLASAQALANEIHGSLDGEEREWHVVTHAEGSTANYHELMPGMLNVTIQGHREEKFATQGTLSIDFMVMQGSPGAASVTYFPENGLTPHYGTETEVPIELECWNSRATAGAPRGGSALRWPMWSRCRVPTMRIKQSPSTSSST